MKWIEFLQTYYKQLKATCRMTQQKKQNLSSEEQEKLLFALNANHPVKIYEKVDSYGNLYSIAKGKIPWQNL